MRAAARVAATWNIWYLGRAAHTSSLGGMLPNTRRTTPCPSGCSPAAAKLLGGECSRAQQLLGDGAAMAYDAGAELMDMEFTQFHPTGMVWPLSVRGILVTEGVRGEGGVLRNNKGDRFMFDNIPERFAPETADTLSGSCPHAAFSNLACSSTSSSSRTSTFDRATISGFAASSGSYASSSSRMVR